METLSQLELVYTKEMVPMKFVDSMSVVLNLWAPQMVARWI